MRSCFAWSTGDEVLPLLFCRSLSWTFSLLSRGNWLERPSSIHTVSPEWIASWRHVQDSHLCYDAHSRPWRTYGLRERRWRSWSYLTAWLSSTCCANPMQGLIHRCRQRPLRSLLKTNYASFYFRSVTGDCQHSGLSCLLVDDYRWRSPLRRGSIKRVKMHTDSAWPCSSIYVSHRSLNLLRHWRPRERWIFRLQRLTRERCAARRMNLSSPAFWLQVSPSESWMHLLSQGWQVAQNCSDRQIYSLVLLLLRYRSRTGYYFHFRCHNWRYASLSHGQWTTDCVCSLDSSNRYRRRHLALR